MNFCYCSISHPSTSSSQHVHVFQLNFDPTNDVPTYVLFYMHISFMPHISSIINCFFFPHTFNPTCENISLPASASICTIKLMSLFTIWLTQISTTTLTHVYRYSPFLANDIYCTKKHHIITFKKRLLYNFSSFDSPSSVLYFYTYLDK